MSSPCYRCVNTLKKGKSKLPHISSFQGASQCGHLGLVPWPLQHLLDSRCKRVIPLQSTLEVREERQSVGDSAVETVAVVSETWLGNPTPEGTENLPTFGASVFGSVWRCKYFKKKHLHVKLFERKKKGGIQKRKEGRNTKKLQKSKVVYNSVFNTLTLWPWLKDSDQNSPGLWCIRIHLLYINLIYGYLQHCSILTEQLHPTVGDKCLLLIKVKAIYSVNDRCPKPWGHNLSFRHVVQNADCEGFLQNSIIQPVLKGF